VKNVLLWMLRKPDKEVGPQKLGKQLYWGKKMNELHIKLS